MSANSLEVSRRRTSLGIVLGVLAFVLGHRVDADAPWTPRATLIDGRGDKHEGTLRRFDLETAGHPTIAPTGTFALNGVPRKSADLAAFRLTWGAIPGSKAPPTLAVAFEFGDGSVVEPLARGKPAPVTSLSIEFAEDGRDPVSWAFQAGKSVPPPFGKIARMTFAQTAPVSPAAPAPAAATLCVHAFEDANGNGVVDRGEQGLAGRLFSITGAVGLSTSASTAKDGAACARVAPGAYRVALSPRAGWAPTTPVSVTVGVVAGRTTDVYFGARKAGGDEIGQLCVEAFDDRNGNGVRDPGESALPGWMFAVTGPPATPLTTGGDGTVCVPLAPGFYTVTESVLAGWSATTPAIQRVTVVAGRAARVAFGARESGGGAGGVGIVCIRKFDDANGNGAQDEGELSLAGWEFTVTDAVGRTSKVRTDAGGDGCLEVAAGTCTIRETPVAGWAATTADPRTVAVVAGRKANVAFGNRRGGASGTLCVHKFADVNGNGAQDPGEPGLPRWTFTVTDAKGASQRVVTMDDGTVCTSVPVGTYTVIETPRAGWSPTTPTLQSAAVTSGQTVDVRFGNREGKPSDDTLPAGVTVKPAGCDCGLGALPALHAIVLRWADLCPVSVLVTPKDGGVPAATWVFGEPRLYRMDHGGGSWQRVSPSNGSAGVLVETALESLPIDPSDKELFRDMVRHYKSPESYVETPLPSGSTAASEAGTIRDLAYLVLVTRFGLTLDLMESMGLGLVDRNVVTGKQYDYVLTVWTPQTETLCSRVNGVEPIAPPPVPVPIAVAAEPLRTTIPDRPGARRPDSSVTPIGVTWISPPAPLNPPSPPYARGAFNVIAYVVERKDGAGGAWVRMGEGPILEVKRTDAPLALSGNPPTSASGYRYLDLATEDLHTYAYRVSALDWIGRAGAPSVVASASAYAIPAPLPWKAFTAVWNGTSHSVDVTLTLRSPLAAGRALWVERAVPTATDPDAGLTRLNATTPWTGSAPTFAIGDATVVEKGKYEYRIVVDGPVSGTKFDMNLRATEVVPDLTPPAALPPLQFMLRPGTPLPPAVTDALTAEHHADQQDQPKWDAAVKEVSQLIADERAALLPLTLDTTETVAISVKAKNVEIGLDSLEGALPDFSADKVPLPLSAEIIYKNGDRARGLLEELDVDGMSLSAHLAPDRVAISCDGRSIPWDETDSISLLWRTTQPAETDTPRRMAIPSIADTQGRLAFPKDSGGNAVGLSTMHVRLTSAVHQTSTGASAPGPAVVSWNFDFEHQTRGATEVRGVRLLGMPWRLGTPGETFLYRWSTPDRTTPPEGRVTKIEIDPTRAPGRKATLSGIRSVTPGAAPVPWSVRGHLLTLGVGTLGAADGQASGLDLNGNLPGGHVTLNGKAYALEDLIRVEIAWLQVPVRISLTFHHRPELLAEHLPQWPEADIKARALSLLEQRRYAPHMADVLASRETVILYWRYPAPANPAELSGFNVYRATGDAPTAFTRINEAPVPFSTVAVPLSSPPAGWPPASNGSGAGTLCWFADALLGGVGTSYSYQVTAVDDTGLESAPNPQVGLLVVVPDRNGPPSPVIVSVRKQHGAGSPPPFQGIRVEWGKPQHAYDVILFRKEAGSSAVASQICVAHPTDPVWYLDPGPFLPAKSYQYFLRGDSGTLGAPSDTRTIEIRSEDVPPVVATPLTAVVAAGAVQLTWGAPTLVAGLIVKGYVVERRKAGASAFRLRAGPMTSTTFADDWVVAGTTYEYRIVMIDSNDAAWLSLFSTVSATVP